MSRTTAAMSPENSRLILGGSLLSTGSSASRAAIAQINIDTDRVEFAREFDFATSIVAIAPLQDKTVVLAQSQASSKTDAEAFVFVLDSHGDKVVGPVTVDVSDSGAELNGASLLFDKGGEHLIVSFAGTKNGLTQVSSYHLATLKQVSVIHVEDFNLASGEQTGVTMPLEETDIDRVYLAGQSGREATLAVASMIDGHLVSSATKLVTFDSQKISDVATVTHIFRQNYQMFGLTSVDATPGKVSQIGVWRMKLTQDGRPRKGAVIQLANTASGSVTGVLPSFENDLMHLMIQDISGDLTYLVIDIAYGQIARATPISQSSTAPVMSLLLTHSTMDHQLSTADISTTIITTKRHQTHSSSTT